MALNLHLTIQDGSPEAVVVESVVARDHISPEEAVRQLILQAGKVSRTPADELIGLFSSPEDSAILDKAMSVVREHRSDYDRIRELDF